MLTDALRAKGMICHCDACQEKYAHLLQSTDRPPRARKPLRNGKMAAAGDTEDL
jgi:hypothetical protein